MNPITKTILTLIILVLLGGGFYFLFFKKNNLTKESLLQKISFEVPKSQYEIKQDFFNLLLNIEKLKINRNFFDNPSFKSLQEPKTEIGSVFKEDLSRANPFAPIGEETQSPLLIVPSITSQSEIATTSEEQENQTNQD